jgi:hypothetical protein
MNMPLVAMDQPTLAGQEANPRRSRRRMGVKRRRRGGKYREVARPKGQSDQREQRQEIPAGVTVRHLVALPWPNVGY